MLFHLILKISMCEVVSHSHFIGEESEAQRGCITCSKSHSKGQSQDLNSGMPNSHSLQRCCST